MENMANQLTLTPELLGLTDIEITEVKLTRDNEITVRVNSTDKKVPCHQCGKLTSPYKTSGRVVRLQHLSILGRKTFIEIIPRRGICNDCNTTTSQTLLWHNRNARMTKAYEQYLLLQLIHSTIVDVSIKEEISETAVQSVVDKYIKGEVDWSKIKRIGILGIDEITLKKGYQDYVTLITSRVGDKNRILAVIKGREKAEIKAFLSTISKKKRKTVVAFCCDMYDGYINAAREIFGDQIPIVVDRYHVAKLYRAALISLRKKELERLRRELSKEDYQSLKKAIALLVKKKELYSSADKQELEKLFKYSPAIKSAYRWARQLTAIFNTHHRKSTGVSKLNEWIEKVESSSLHCFNGFVGTLTKYQDYISNYFLQRHNSGFVEGLNNKFKVLKRRCYGIVNVKHLFQRIFLDLNGYDLLKNNAINYTVMGVS